MCKLHGEFEKCLNASFVALIPKKGGSENIRDFSHISLLDRAYKFLAKVLAIRQKSVLGKFCLGFSKFICWEANLGWSVCGN